MFEYLQNPSISTLFFFLKYVVTELLFTFSTRVSNQLGAGNHQGARISVISVALIAATETILVSTTVFACRNVFGYIFSNEKEVVDYVANMAPLLCLSVITDSFQGTLSG